MNERIESLRTMGRIVDEPAADQEVAGVWLNAVEAYEDACLTNRAPNRRLTAAYDGGRLAALAVVRATNLRVRAQNHHEVTLAVAGLLVGDALEILLQKFQERRMDRIQIEYGWAKRATADEVADAAREVRSILQLAGSWIQGQRAAISADILIPE